MQCQHQLKIMDKLLSPQHATGLLLSIHVVDSKNLLSQVSTMLCNRAVQCNYSVGQPSWGFSMTRQDKTRRLHHSSQPG